MNIKEAIEQLESEMIMLTFNPETGEELTLEQIAHNNINNYWSYCANKLAIFALESQVPKKPVQDEYENYCCPSCGWYKACEDAENWGYVLHCSNCGQAIDLKEIKNE